MAQQSGDQQSRLQEYQERFEKLMAAAREEFGRQAPEVLDKLAASAKNMGQRLDEMASEARRNRAEKEVATSQPAAEPSGEPGTTSDESGTPGA